ncbi:MAG TPA: phosphoglycerate kinase [Candidatus Methylomirabilis sp.]|nr:phosphoglycerate kinase [Candidatus Methylomirabilis sp.]
MAKLFIEDLQLSGKRVLMRVDFNVPVTEGRVENDRRLRASLPSIRYVLDHGASLVLMSHLGRPDGQRIGEYSLGPVAERLQELLGARVRFLPDCVGPDVERACAALKPGEVVVLENLRFHIEEEGKVKKDDGGSVKADPGAVAAFRASLTRLGEVYVNDAFGTAHRAHSSIVGVNLPHRAAGYLMKKELDFLGEAVDTPKRPFVAIIGGAKVSGKIDVIESLLPKVDTLLIGGGMAFTFLKARGQEIGGSLVENDRIEMARALLAKANSKLMLPVDVVVTDVLDFRARKIGALRTVSWGRIGPKDIGVDVGEATRATFAAAVKHAGTVVWNGPMGIIEIPAAAGGTCAIAQALAEATAKGAVTVVGGGDSVAAIEAYGLADKVTHVSTGGGASLEFLEGKELPGVTYLSEK